MEAGIIMFRKCQPGHWFDPFLSVIDSPVTDVDAVVTGCPHKCPPGRYGSNTPPTVVNQTR